MRSVRAHLSWTEPHTKCARMTRKARESWTEPHTKCARMTRKARESWTEPHTKCARMTRKARESWTEPHTKCARTKTGLRPKSARKTEDKDAHDLLDGRVLVVVVVVVVVVDIVVFCHSRQRLGRRPRRRGSSARGGSGYAGSGRTSSDTRECFTSTTFDVPEGPTASEEAARRHRDRGSGRTTGSHWFCRSPNVSTNQYGGTDERESHTTETREALMRKERGFPRRGITNLRRP
jgi:hypothetical protein